MTPRNNRDNQCTRDSRVAIPLALAFALLVMSSVSVRSDNKKNNTCIGVSLEAGVLSTDTCSGSGQDNLSKELPLFTFAPVAINRAGLEELQTVKGVGPRLAKEIIAYRNARGSFTGEESLMLLKGVGERRASSLSTQFSFD